MGVRCKCFTSPALSRQLRCVTRAISNQDALLGLCLICAHSWPPAFPCPTSLLSHKGFLTPHCHLTLCLRVCPWEASLSTHCVPSLVFCPGSTVFYKSHTCTHVHPHATKNVPSNNRDAGRAAENKTVRAPALEKLTLL